MISELRVGNIIIPIIYYSLQFLLLLDNGILEEAVKLIIDSDVLIIGGTSLSVYPAAGLVNYYRGKKLILINRAKTAFDSRANYVFYGNIGELLHKVVE